MKVSLFDLLSFMPELKHLSETCSYDICCMEFGFAFLREITKPVRTVARSPKVTVKTAPFLFIF